MSQLQVPVKGVMAIVVLLAVGMGAIMHPSDLWASLIFSATVAALTIAVLAAAASRGRARLCWFGFALFGWVYLTFAFLAPEHAPFQRYGTPPLVTDLIRDFVGRRNQTLPIIYVRSILHSIGVTIAAVCGYLTAFFMAAQSEEPRP